MYLRYSRSVSLGALSLALLATTATAQVSATGPFAGDLVESFDAPQSSGPYSPGGMAIYETAFGDITSPTQSMHRSSFFNSFNSCTVTPQGSDTFLVKYSPDCFAGGSYRFDFQFTEPVRSFGAYFAQDAPSSSVTHVQAFGRDGSLVLDTVANLPDECGWHWMGWSADAGEAISSIMIRHIGYASLAVDEARVRLDRPGTTYCSPTVPNSTGGHGELHLGGSEFLRAGELDFVVQGLPAEQTGVLLAGRAASLGETPFNSQGSICVAGEMSFVPLSVFATEADGTRGLALEEPAAPGLADGTTFHAGETWYFQVWYRDRNPVPVSNTTNAVWVTFQ